MSIVNFFFRYKKIFLGIGIILTAIALGYLIFFLFFYQEQPTTTPSHDPNVSQPGVGLPEADEGAGQVVPDPDDDQIPPADDIITDDPEDDQIDDTAKGGVTKTTPLTETPALHPTLNKDGDGIQYYNPEDGKFYKIDKDGNIATLSDLIFQGVEKVIWAPDKNKAVLERFDGANVIYNFETKSQIALPKHWEEYDFSPNSDKLVFKNMGLDPDSRWLATVDSTGENFKLIEKMGNNSDTVISSWSPNQQIIAMYTKGKDFDRQEVFFVGQNNENFRAITVEGRGFEPLWSNEGDRLIYSVYSSRDDMKPMLWSTNASGNNIGTDRKSLSVNTWASKCNFSSNSEVYCGVPQNLEEGAGMFPELAQNTVDNLYKINLETGNKTLIAVPDGDYNISDVQISSDESTLFFTDLNTQKVHKIDL